MTVPASSSPTPASGAHPAPESTTAPGAEIMERPSPPSAGVPRNRAADRAANRAFRPRRVVPAVITAALMTLLGVLVAVEAVSALLGRSVRWIPYDRILGWASSTPWNSPQVLLGGSVLTALGLLLVLLALVPGQPRLIPARTGDPDLIIGMQRRGFTRSLAHAARQVEGVDHARVTLHGRTAQVRADSSLRDTTGLAEAVRQAVTGRIAALSPVDDHPVRVNVRGR
ncbi:DUF6286 domain-containing protein [Streptosporangium sp. NBC_01639]|uniref:DUF6286 domain-containing protein n=1 Tax=Streptosporangium sp. NBC_01639 TaxID=2975948 RepID=UPI0038660680|nr:DUF6286 domain-containing protein [Streptosporangium sp. NBC_01639]